MLFDFKIVVFRSIGSFYSKLQLLNVRIVFKIYVEKFWKVEDLYR